MSPVTDAGILQEPSVSEQKPAGAERIATAAAVPPLLPAHRLKDLGCKITF